MVKSVVLFVLLGLVAVNYANAADLKCYQCEACHDGANLPEAKACSKDTVKPPAWAEATDAPTITTDPPGIGTFAADKPLTNKFKREVKEDEAKAEFQCFTQLVKFGENRVIRRGCTKATQEVCKAEGESCDLCDTEACNFANNVPSWTFGSLLLVAIIKMFF